MPTTIPVMTRISPAVKKKLRAIAKNTERSEAFLARAAIEQFVDVNDWQIALIESRLAQANSGAERVPHEDVVRWLDAKSAGKKPSVPRSRP